MTYQTDLSAVLAAIDTRSQHGLDDDTLIDPFAVLRELVDLFAISPLDGALGLTLHIDGLHGVLLTSQRPEHIQRYTAAHEIGHIVLGHAQSCLDQDAQVTGRPENALERAAQLFAASLLMPTRALSERFEHYRREATSLGAIVYQVGRDLRVSFEACINQLVREDLLSVAQARQLKRIKPIDVKRALGDGLAPLDARAQVWRAVATDSAMPELAAGDELIVEFAAFRSKIPRHLTGTSMEAVANAAPDTVRLRAVEPGSWALSSPEFELAGSVRESAEAINSQHLTDAVAPHPF